MQLRLPWDRARPGPLPTPPRSAAPVELCIDGRTFRLTIARHRRARRYVLRLTRDGSLRLTVPRGASIAAGIHFAEGQGDWLAREWARHAVRLAPWTTGTTLWFRGDRVPLVVTDVEVRLGPESIPRPTPTADVRAVVEQHCRQVATRELVPRTLELAAQCAVHVQRVSVRNQKSRWGACSGKGVITLNWRLLLMPAAVSDYVIFHELMHRRQPNHSRRFWREVDGVCPTWRDSERWLRKHGKEL